ncbi:MAG: OmpH family outer membrane protein [Flavobacteriales bacterium]
MKKGILILTLLISTLSCIEAQNKFGYLNSNELLSMMPESLEMQTELENQAKKLESQLSAMQSEYESKVVDFQKNETTFSDLVKEDKIKEIESIQKRMVDFQQRAQKELAEKEAALFTPIREKAMDAINKVAQEGNYTYIFDSGAGTFLYVDESENIIEKVKKKLGM